MPYNGGKATRCGVAGSLSVESDIQKSSSVTHALLSVTAEDNVTLRHEPSPPLKRSHYPPDLVAAYPTSVPDTTSCSITGLSTGHRVANA
eukprot:3649766-Rhodomonas_salina.2